MRSMIRQVLRCCLIVPVLVLFAVAAAAQTSGTLKGTVVDENGTLLADATVTVVNENNGVPKTARTNVQGQYTIPFLEPGRYTIVVTKAGYQDSQQGNFVIPLNKTTVTLPPIVLTTQPVATATTTPSTPATATPSAPDQPESNKTLVNLTDATNRGNYNENLLLTLPLSGIRTFDQFALLAPGVLPSPQTSGAAGPGLGPGVGTSGQFSVNGRPARANNFTIDGSDNNDQDIGVRRQGFVSLVPQSIESVNEFQISTQTWDSELGRNIGAQVNAVSRSGGNDIHGTAYGFFTNNRLNARNFFDLTGGPSADEDSLTRVQAGFVLGGPIVKNRTHYFASFERQENNGTQENHFAVPDDANRIFNGGPFRTDIGQALFNIIPRPNNLRGPYGINNFTQVLPANGEGTVLSFKLTQTIGKSQLTGRYNFTDDESIIPSVGGAINASLGTNTRTQNISLFYDSALTPTSFNQVRFSYGRTTLGFDQQPGSPLLFGESPTTFNPQRLISQGIAGPGSEAYLQSVTTPFGTFGPFGRSGPIGQLIVAPFSPIGIDPFTFPQGRTNNTFQLADTFVKQLGAHSFKFGADFRYNQLNSFLDRNFRPQIIFNGGTLLNTDFGLAPRPLIGTDSLAGGVVSQIFQTLALTPDSTIGLRFTEYNFFAQDNWKVTKRLTLDYGIRYEYSSVPEEANNRIEDTFNINFPASDPRIGRAAIGSQFQGLFEGFLNDAIGSLNRFLDGRDKIYRPDRNNVSPRVGIAYDLFGNSKTVLRAGYGLYYDQIIGSVTSQSRNVFPSFIPLVLDPIFAFDPQGRVLFVPGAFVDNVSLADVGLSIPTILPGTLNTLGFGGGLLRYGLGEILLATGARAGEFTGGGPRGGGLAFILPDANLRTPYSQHWNFSVEHQFAKDFVVSASYVGSTGTKLIRFRTPNGGPNSYTIIDTDTDADLLFVPTPQSPRRNDPNLGPFTVIESSASSNYHSLQLSLNKRLSSGLQFGTSYTFSHAIDEVSEVFDTAGGYALPQNNDNLAAERASANFDVRHRSVTHFVYELPFFKNNQLLGGWQMTGILQLQTGQPFTVNLAVDANRDGNRTDRPRAGFIKQLDDGVNRLDVPQLSARERFRLLAGNFGRGDTDGDLGRNTFRAPGIATFDLAVVKKFQINERHNLLVRTEFFNLFNRTHFAIPVRLVEAPGFGNSVSTSLPARVIQFAIKYSF